MGELGEGPQTSFLALLLEKLSKTIQIEKETGVSTAAAQAEARRQISQAIRGGDPIGGKGVTKSGGDD